VIIKIGGSSFTATLSFSDNHLIGYFIEYDEDGESLTINGANLGVEINRYYYIDENDKEQTVEKVDFETPEDKDLLAKFNETIMEQFKEEILKGQFSEVEARQFLLELLNYINDKITKGGVLGLIEKVRNAVKSENIKVEFHQREEITSNKKNVLSS